MPSTNYEKCDRRKHRAELEAMWTLFGGPWERRDGTTATPCTKAKQKMGPHYFTSLLIHPADDAEKALLRKVRNKRKAGNRR